MKRTCGCLDWLVRPVLREDDTEEEASLKSILIKGCFLLTGIISLTQIEKVVLDGGIPATIEWYALTLFCVAVAFFGYPWLVWAKCIQERLIVGLLILGCPVIMALDMTAQANLRARAVGLFVLVLDVSLIFNISSAYVNGFMAVAIAWILLTSFEITYRFGLLDMPGMPPYEGRRALCDCEAPPCATGELLDDTAIMTTVLFLDFFVTRGFSRDLRAKKAALEKSVDVMGAIAHHLAAYDLSSADSVLSEHSHELPADMVDVFHSLLGNLRSYRPYLPDALFTVADDADGSDRDDCVTESAASTASSFRSAHSDGLSRQSYRTGSRYMSLGQVCAPLHAIGSSQLELKHVTVLLAAMQLGDLSGNADTYVALHSKWLSAVFTAVKANRGSLDSFTGDRICASFNAFRVARGHAANAMAVAGDLLTHDDGTYGVKTAVVTGAAHAGFLGTATVRSPMVVGPLMVQLELVARAREAVGVASICCAKTAFEVSCMFPLRVLLHTFVFESTAAAVTLYELVVQKGKIDDPQEWMYELEGNGVDVWVQYNKVAAIFQTEGAVAAQKAFEGGEEAARFAECVAEAHMIDLRVHHTAHAPNTGLLDKQVVDSSFGGELDGSGECGRVETPEPLRSAEQLI